MWNTVPLGSSRPAVREHVHAWETFPTVNPGDTSVRRPVTHTHIDTHIHIGSQRLTREPCRLPELQGLHLDSVAAPL